MSSVKVVNMKFVAVAVFAVLCLVAVSANATFDEAQNEIDFQYVPEDFASDPEALLFVPNIFGPMFWLLKGVLRTLKGLNCTIKGVVNIKNSAETFIDDVNSCGGVVSKQVQSVITACKTVITTSEAIFTLNDEACKNGNYNNETDGTTKTPYFSCFVKISTKILQLNSQIKNVLSLIKKVPDAGTGAGVCVHTALTDLSSAFTQFPSMVKSCSKLTS